MKLKAITEKISFARVVVGTIAALTLIAVNALATVAVASWTMSREYSEAQLATTSNAAEIERVAQTAKEIGVSAHGALNTHQKFANGRLEDHEGRIRTLEAAQTELARMNALLEGMQRQLDRIENRR